MKKISNDIIGFFENQGFVIVTTVDKNGSPHNSCKGIIKIDPNGIIYLLDVYIQHTHENLKYNPNISITAVDEHKFKGYTLKGIARTPEHTTLDPGIIKAWEDRITGRLTSRLLKNIREEKGHPRHPEALFPKPEYMIVMEVKEIVDLTPHNLKGA